MQIVPSRIISGSIIVNAKIPALSLGKTLTATVLSEPKGKSVLVSFFGKRVRVETTIPLHKGQVLNLKVHALSPRIILKPAQQVMDTREILKGLKSLVEDLVGTLGKTPVKTFRAEEIFTTLARLSPQDPGLPQFVSTLMEQMNLHPQALAFLFIPLVEKDSHSHARVAIEKKDQGYIIHFEMNTDHLGQMECTARLDEVVDVEIRTSSQETADLLRAHIHELHTGLEPLGVRSCEVVVKQLERPVSPGVDVLV
jgi:hypothetical protein